MTVETATLGTPMAATSSGRRLRRRHLLLIPGLAIAVYANELAKIHGIGLALVIAFGIIPHLPVLLGRGQPHAPGQMAARAIPLFNLMHHPVPPLMLLGVATVAGLGTLWSVAALVWASHIVIDLALGDGLRTADGWRRGTVAA